MNKLITIGREFGSGGRELGRRLAEELGIEYYDKEIITEIAKKTELSEAYIQQVVEGRPHHLYPITVGHSMSFVGSYYLKQEHSIYFATSEILTELADKSDCIIVGRCADYILRDRDPYRIFVYADIDSRMKRCIERSPGGENYTEKQIKKRIMQVDKNRAKYYEYYTARKWGAMRNYDLCVNTTGVVIKNIVPHIAKMFLDE
jgi:cytidylate kinase